MIEHVKDVYRTLPESVQEWLRENRLARTAWKTNVVYGYFKRDIKNGIGYIVHPNELTNYTYDIGDLNKKHLSGFVSAITGDSIAETEKYIRELESDDQLRDHVRKSQRYDSRYREPKYGGRLGWYALVRALKPNLVVESGVDDGLGTCVISAALMRNGQQGVQGRVHGIDIDPKAGTLYSPPYSNYGEITHSPTVPVLEDLKEDIDVFIHDSSHEEEHIEAELDAISENLSGDSILISDAAHHLDTLYEYSRRNDRYFLFFREEPASHWYRGGFGVSFYDDVRTEK